MATRLKITSLKFISAVDAGAQGPIANVALVKRAPTGDEFQLTCKVSKLDESLGVVFGYAVASTIDKGESPHIDLQGDAVLGGDELIKVALGFAEAGAHSDVMHDCIKDGWVPFVMPLNAETKKAFQLDGEVEGIAIGMKPSSETFKRFVDGELGAFSIYGTGIREPLEQGKRAPNAPALNPSWATRLVTAKSVATKVQKGSLYTDEVDGHQHKISVYDDGSMYVEWATMTGADNSHSHGVVRGEDGTLEILADSGHKHALAEGQPMLVVVPMDAIVVVAARDPNAARASKSTRFTAVGNVNAQPEPMNMKTEAEKIADLEKQLSELTKRFSLVRNLSTTEHSLWKSLEADIAGEFLSKSVADRAPLIAEFSKTAEVVYKAADGTTYTKAQADLARLHKMADSERALRLDGEIAKRAGDLFAIVKCDDNSHIELLKAIDAIEDGTKRDAVMKTVTLLTKNTTLGKSAPGFNGTELPEGGAADAVYEKALVAFCKANKIEKVWTAGRDAFDVTDEGKPLAEAYVASLQ